MYQRNIFIVRLPAPLQQEPLTRQQALADIAYRWAVTLNLLLAAIGALLALAGM